MTVQVARLERLLAEATKGRKVTPLDVIDWSQPANLPALRLAALAINALPALLAAAKALNEAVLLEYDHREGGSANAELKRRAENVREALAALSFEEQGGEGP